MGEVGIKTYIAWFFNKPFITFLCILILFGFGLYKLLSSPHPHILVDEDDTDDISLDVNYRDISDTNQDSNRQAEGVDTYPMYQVKPAMLRLLEWGLGKNTMKKCRFQPIDWNSVDIQGIMTDFGELECEIKNHEVKLKDNRVEVSGQGINLVQYRGISLKDNVVEYGNFQYLVPPRVQGLLLKRGQSGTIQNAASKRCLKASITSIDENLPAEVEVHFDDDCTSAMTKFTFEANGLLRHQPTNRCLQPASGVPFPPDDTLLTLSTLCESHFEVIGAGVLRHSEGRVCVHPFGGGDMPELNQKICLYNDCEDAKRLFYHWYSEQKDVKPISVNASLSKSEEELLEIQVSFVDETVKTEFALYVKPKPLPEILSQQPTVIMLTLDQASAAHIKRKLPLSYKHMKEVMGMRDFNMYSAISSSSQKNMDALYTGHTDHTIFQRAKKYGYMTSFSVDMPSMFNRSYPTLDHNSVPLFTAAQSKYSTASNPYCLSSQPIFNLVFNYLTSFLQAYPASPRLAVVALAEITHMNYNGIGYLDKALLNLFQMIQSLKNTVFIMNSVKGSLIGKLGKYQQGLVEFKQPFLSVYTSPDIKDRYKRFKPHKVLVTPYDVYTTLSGLVSKKKILHKYGQRFDKIKNTRSCKDAGIESIMCPCL